MLLLNTSHGRITKDITIVYIWPKKGKVDSANLSIWTAKGYVLRATLEF